MAMRGEKFAISCQYFSIIRFRRRVVSSRGDRLGTGTADQLSPKEWHRGRPQFMTRLYDAVLTGGGASGGTTI